MKKLVLAAAMACVAVSATAAPDMAKYKKSCGVCHEEGTAGAQKSHDVAAWTPRLAKGMDALLASINNGLNAMPPKGMCFDCSDDDYRELIMYMASPK